jgi:hypothetical protein
MLSMKENPSTASDNALSQLVFESQITVQKLDFIMLPWVHSETVSV